MARVWRRVDLVGTRNGINKDFTIPNFNPTSTIWIIFNGRLLYETNLTPAATQVYRLTGANVTLGVAPEANDNVWAIISEATQYNLDYSVAVAPPGAAAVYISRVDKSFYFYVNIYDKTGALVEQIEKDVRQISWSYGTVGGCLVAPITIRRPFDQFGNIGLEYQIEIWRDLDPLGVAGVRLPFQLDAQLGTSLQGTKELRWSGYVAEMEPVCDGDDELVVLSCNGWSRQLDQLIVNNAAPYSNMDVGAIVRDLIDNWVLAGSQIKHTSAFALIPDTGIIVGSIQFFTTVSSAIGTLAGIAGDTEWGVRADKEFYFKVRTQTVRQTHVIEDRVKIYRPLFSTDDTVNRVYVQGNNVKGVVDLGAYETGYQKERLVPVGSITNAQTLTLWGTAYGAKYAPGQAKPSGRLQIAASDVWIEQVGEPIDLLRVIGGPVFVAAGDRLQAQLPIRLAAIYGDYTDESFRVHQIEYRPEADALTADVILGPRGNDLADLLGGIEYKIGEVIQGATQ